MIFNNVLEAVGNTPMIRLNHRNERQRRPPHGEDSRKGQACRYDPSGHGRKILQHRTVFPR